MKHVFTIDNLLHVFLGAAVIFLAWLYLPLAAAAALYLRESGQARSWGLSFHKFAEFFFPSITLIALWEGLKWLSFA
jgi:ABC-type spermidine/putrescine transport system permease subunit II